MDISKLKRDPEYVLSKLKETNTGSVLTTSELIILIPQRFEVKKLLFNGEYTDAVGIFALVMGDRYAVMSVNAMVTLHQTSTNIVNIDDMNYYQYTYLAGSEFMKTTEVVIDDFIIYNIFDEFISNGNVPWYFEYRDMAELFITSKDYAGSNIGGNKIVNHLIVSVLSRNRKDRMKYYRHQINTKKDLIEKPSFVPLKSVMYVATNTLNKFAGSYFSEAIVSALVHPTDKVEKIESLLRE